MTTPQDHRRPVGGQDGTPFQRTVIWLLTRIYKAVTAAHPLPPEVSDQDKLMEAWVRNDPDQFWDLYGKEMEKRRDSQN